MRPTRLDPLRQEGCRSCPLLTRRRFRNRALSILLVRDQTDRGDRERVVDLRVLSAELARAGQRRRGPLEFLAGCPATRSMNWPSCARRPAGVGDLRLPVGVHARLATVAASEGSPVSGEWWDAWIASDWSCGVGRRCRRIAESPGAAFPLPRGSPRARAPATSRSSGSPPRRDTRGCGSSRHHHCKIVVGHGSSSVVETATSGNVGTARHGGVTPPG